MTPPGPSSFFLAHREALHRAARLGPVLDLACGRGRHALAVAGDGIPTLALDRNREFLEEVSARARERRLPVHAVRADLETPHGIPVRSESCGVILVFRFLFRPLAPAILEALRPGGLLLYETFTLGQRALGHGPRNPAFLLEPGELAALFPGTETLESWEGTTAGERPEALARLAARKL